MSIKIGDEVTIHFTAKLETGKVVETTIEGKPQSYRIGSGALLPGLEEALIGLKQGDKLTIKIPPKKGFGERREDLLDEVPKSLFDKEIRFSEGMVVELHPKEGGKIMAVVRTVKKNTITVDLNHPYAGRTLEFNIEIVKVSAK